LKPHTCNRLSIASARIPRPRAGASLKLMLIPIVAIINDKYPPPAGGGLIEASEA